MGLPQSDRMEIIMERLKRIGKLEPRHSLDVKESPMGLGMEKLDRDAFDPEKVYDKVAALGVKWIRIQSGWQKTEKEEGVYDFAWLDSQVDNLLSRGLTPWLCLCYGNTLYHRNVTVRNCYFDQGWVATLNHVDNFVFENNTSNGKMMISANACGERLNTGAFK